MPLNVLVVIISKFLKESWDVFLGAYWQYVYIISDWNGLPSPAKKNKLKEEQRPWVVGIPTTSKVRRRRTCLKNSLIHPVIYLREIVFYIWVWTCAMSSAALLFSLLNIVSLFILFWSCLAYEYLLRITAVFLIVSCILCFQSEFEAAFKEYDSGATFNYLKSFRRARVNFSTTEATVQARLGLNDKVVCGQPIKCYFAQVRVTHSQNLYTWPYVICASTYTNILAHAHICTHIY